MTDTLSGKRVLNMTVARTILPPSCYVYETTDGKRVRVVFVPRRQSTSARIAIGHGKAMMFCIRWSWTVYECKQHDLGIVQVDVCQYDVDKIKLS